MKECEQGAVHRDRLHHSCCLKAGELELQIDELKKLLRSVVGSHNEGHVPCNCTEICEKTGLDPETMRYAEKPDPDTCIPKPTGRALQYCSEYQKTSHDHSPSCSFWAKRTEERKSPHEPEEGPKTSV